jgi:hypothetical protein
VVEYNQASRQPRIVDDEPYDQREDAEEVAQNWRDQLIASGSGRREEYEVWECNPMEDDD